MMAVTSSSHCAVHTGTTKTTMPARTLSIPNTMAQLRVDAFPASAMAMMPSMIQPMPIKMTVKINLGFAGGGGIAQRDDSRDQNQQTQEHVKDTQARG